jgi:hypothetical protein
MAPSRIRPVDGIGMRGVLTITSHASVILAILTQQIK